MIHRRRNSHRRFRYSLEYKKKVLQSIRLIGIGRTMRKMDVKKDQVKYWMMKEDEIMNTPSEDCVGRFRLSKTAYADIAQEEQQLYDWIMDRKKNGENVLNDEIIERATTIFCGLPEVKTKASRKWLVSFKRRYGLAKEAPPRPKRVPGEAAPEGKSVAAAVETKRATENAKNNEVEVIEVRQEDFGKKWEERWEEENVMKWHVKDLEEDASFMMIDADDSSETEFVRPTPEIITIDDC